MKRIEDIKPLLLAHYHACQAQDWDEAATTASRMYKFLHNRGYFETIRDLYEQLIPSDWRNGKQLVVSTSDHTDILYRLGFAYSHMGQPQTANDYLQQSISIAKRIGDPQREAIALLYTGFNYQSLGHCQVAIDCLEECLAIANNIKENKLKYLALDNLGYIHDCMAEYHVASQFFSQALVVARQIRFLEGEGFVLGQLGRMYIKMRKYDLSVHSLKQYLAIYQKLPKRQDNVYEMLEVDDFNKYSLEYYLEPLKSLQEPLKVYIELVDKKLEIYDKSILLTAYNGLDEYQSFMYSFAQGAKFAREFSPPHIQADAWYKLGLTYQKLGQLEQSIENRQSSDRYFSKIEARAEEAEVLVELAKTILRTKIGFQQTVQYYLNQAEQVCLALQLPLLNEVQKLKADLKIAD